MNDSTDRVNEQYEEQGYATYEGPRAHDQGLFETLAHAAEQYYEASEAEQYYGEEEGDYGEEEEDLYEEEEVYYRQRQEEDDEYYSAQQQENDVDFRAEEFDENLWLAVDRDESAECG